MTSPVIEARDVSKTFEEGALTVPVLKAVSLRIAPGEQVAIVGASGAGKSTLLHLLGGLDIPSQGRIEVAGEDLARLNERARARLRNSALGFVYQFHHLLPEFTALENVAMPLVIRNRDHAGALEQAHAMLGQMGLAGRALHKPSELSGGERQRVAVARALVTRPLCLLADEPTGNLDRQSAERVYGEMLALNRAMATALVIVTHDQGLARRMDRILTMVDGTLTDGGGAS